MARLLSIRAISRALQPLAIVSRSALPKKAKIKNVFVELILIFRALHVYANVQHVVGNAPIRNSFAAVSRLQRTLEILHKLNVVSLGIFDDKAVIAV